MARQPKPETAGRKPSTRALKVYSVPAGFYDAVVAAPNQKAALQAWGTNTDLFAAGRATIVEDGTIKAEALSRPGEVIKRSRGSEAAMLGPEPVVPRLGSPKAKPASKPRPPPDRSRLDAAERVLAQAERQFEAELDAFAREREDVDRREREVRRTGADRLKGLSEAVSEAETTFRKAQDCR